MRTWRDILDIFLKYVGIPILGIIALYAFFRLFRIYVRLTDTSEPYEDSNTSKKSDFDITNENLIREKATTLRQEYEKCCVNKCLANALYLSDKDCEQIKKDAKDNLQKYFELRWRDFEYNNGLSNYLDKNEENIEKYKKLKEATTLMKKVDNLRPLPYPYTVKKNKSILSSYR